MASLRDACQRNHWQTAPLALLTFAPGPRRRDQEKRDRCTTCTRSRRKSEAVSLVIDEPTDLPEGTEWKLVLVDSWADEMDPEERAEFLRELEISAAEADAAQLIDAADVLVSSERRREHRPRLRRLRLEKTKCHVYFEVDENNAEIRILMIWGAPRGREPKL